ncbi:MAG: hypothetical protein IT266_03125 [Saprospiraceae bacterium]|nr:hypothetical protein [Saprospiraceae bacterium]
MRGKEYVGEAATSLAHGIYLETGIRIFSKKFFNDGFLGGFTFAVKKTDAL